jgi:hypothetical protein
MGINLGKIDENNAAQFEAALKNSMPKQNGGPQTFSQGNNHREAQAKVIEGQEAARRDKPERTVSADITKKTETIDAEVIFEPVASDEVAEQSTETKALLNQTLLDENVNLRKQVAELNERIMQLQLANAESQAFGTYDKNSEYVVCTPTETKRFTNGYKKTVDPATGREITAPRHFNLVQDIPIKLPREVFESLIPSGFLKGFPRKDTNILQGRMQASKI